MSEPVITVTLSEDQIMYLRHVAMNDDELWDLFNNALYRLRSNPEAYGGEVATDLAGLAEKVNRNAAQMEQDQRVSSETMNLTFDV